MAADGSVPQPCLGAPAGGSGGSGGAPQPCLGAPAGGTGGDPCPCLAGAGGTWLPPDADAADVGDASDGDTSDGDASPD